LHKITDKSCANSSKQVSLSLLHRVCVWAENERFAERSSSKVQGLERRKYFLFLKVKGEKCGKSFAEKEINHFWGKQLRSKAISLTTPPPAE
jgi:hypothetical protein